MIPYDALLEERVLVFLYALTRISGLVIVAPAPWTVAPARVRGVQRLGGRVTSELEIAGQSRLLEQETFDAGGAAALAVGDTVHFRPARYRVFAVAK